MKSDLEEIIICACKSTEHQIIFRTICNDEDHWVYIDIHLAKRKWVKRFWYGIKYIFGFQSKYGAFEEIIITPEESHKLEKVVNYLKKGG